MSYLDTISQRHKAYFNVLSDEIPNWLYEYIETPEMLRLAKISMDCGCDYSGLFKKHDWHSNLDHSIGVALIIWHFTKDKKQTLSGLFHDIATPAFKHCIDFMNGDYLHQESTEERTTQIIEQSKEIMRLLKRDGIKVNEVDNYKIYPIADNHSPMLSADRFEYNMSCGYIIHPEIWNLQALKRCYEDVIVSTNESGEQELVFQHHDNAKEFILRVSKLWPYWINDADRITMQYLSDVCVTLQAQGELTVDDLYNLSEQDIINKILNSQNTQLVKSYKQFTKIRKCYRVDHLETHRYCVNVPSKRRYIDPYVLQDQQRISKSSKEAQSAINEYFQISTEGYISINVDSPK